LALMLMMMMLGIIGVSYNSGANCTHNLSAHKGNMLCIWANRKWKDIYHAAIASQSYSRYHGFDAAANIPKSGSSTMAKLL
jgi:hypothetical protein